jgi:O-antigen/teichoic acid export membrane protein
VEEDNKSITEQKSSYRGIFKATSLFGGVQVYKILIEVIKSKFIAVLIGPTGVGIQGLYTSATGFVQQLTSFGLSSSAVRNVAEAYGTGDRTRVAKVVYALRRLVWITGLLGMVAVIAFSPILSKSSFGDSAHTIPFIIISVTLLLNQLNAGQNVVLQGTWHLKYLAKSGAIGVTLGLIIAVPLYYWLGVDGIVPNIIITAVTTLCLSWYFSRKVDIDKTPMTNKEAFVIGKTMLTMGIAMSLTNLFTSASGYVLRACIRLWGGVEVVGLFTAGNILMSQYTGLVFSAMSTDFYPRLSAVNQDNEKCRLMMNQQGEIGMLILSPLLLGCIVFIPWVVRLLYSDAFLPINDFVIWCCIGMLFKMASWSISYIFLAKGEAKLYMVNETAVGAYRLLFNLLGYRLGGLQGMGIAFSLTYLFYLIQNYLIARRKYDFSFMSSFVQIFVIQFLMVVSCMACAFFLPIHWKYLIGIPLFLGSGWYSLRELNKKLDLKAFINSKIKK